MNRTLKVAFVVMALCLCSRSHAQLLHACEGAADTVGIVNSQNLNNPSFVLYPGGISSPNGLWTVTLTANISYTMYITGTTGNNVVLTYSSSVSYSVHPTPTLTTLYSVQNFTLGCGSRSLVTVTITPSPQPPQVMATTYSFVSAVTKPAAQQMGQWPVTNELVVTSPGNYKAVAFFAGSPGCYDTLNFSVISNTAGPIIDSVSLSPGISCADSAVIMQAYTSGQNLTWAPFFAGEPVTGPTNTAYLPGGYTLTAQNPHNLCYGETVVTVPEQRIYPQIAQESPYSVCNTGSVVISPTVTGGSDFTYDWFNHLGSQLSTGDTVMVQSGGIYFLTVTNGYGCSGTTKLTVIDCTALPEVTGETLSVWPVPAGDHLYISFENYAEREVRLFDSSLELIRSLLVNKTDMMNLSDVPSGLYFLQAGNKWQKVIRE